MPRRPLEKRNCGCCAACGVRILGSGAHSTVYATRYRILGNDVKTVLKVFNNDSADSYQHWKPYSTSPSPLTRELRAYEALVKAGLDGMLLPKFYGIVHVKPCDSKIPQHLEAIYLDRVHGKPLDKLQLETINIDLAAWESRLTAHLRQLHSAGVLHGDIHRQNIMMTDTNALCFIDLSKSVTRVDEHTDEEIWLAGQERDLRDLRDTFCEIKEIQAVFNTRTRASSILKDVDSDKEIPRTVQDELATLLQTSKDAQVATSILEKSGDSVTPALCLNIAQSLRLGGQCKRATELINKNLGDYLDSYAINAHYLRLLHQELGRILATQLQYGKAIQQYDAALSVKSESQTDTKDILLCEWERATVIYKQNVSEETKFGLQAVMSKLQALSGTNDQQFRACSQQYSMLTASTRTPLLSRTTNCSYFDLNQNQISNPAVTRVGTGGQKRKRSNEDNVASSGSTSRPDLRQIPLKRQRTMKMQNG